MRHFSLLLACFALTLAGCAGLDRSFREPGIDLVGFSSAPSRGLQPGFRLQLRLTNPNSKPLVLTGVDYEIAIEGHKLADGNLEGFTIPAQGEKTVASTVYNDLGSDLRLLADLASRPRSQLGYTVKARVRIGGWLLPLPVTKSGLVHMGGH